MVRRAVAALATALLVAACGFSSHSTSTSSSSPSTTASSASSTSMSPQTSSSSATSTAASSSSTTRSAAHHTHTQPPESTPHFVVKLKLGSNGTLTPPSVAIGGHTAVELSVSNASGGSAKLEVAHGSTALFAHTLPPGRTTAKLPALKNATYALLVDGRPRGTLTIGAKAGP